MAVETVKSLFITNRDATPVVGTVAAIAGANLRSSVGAAVVSASASIASYYPLVQVPSNSRVRKVELQCAALGAGCLANIGVFAPTQTNTKLLALNAAYTSGAAINATFFASSVDVSAALNPIDETNQSGTNTIAKQEQELWQALGLASDPSCNFDIAVKLAGAAVAGGAILLKVDYAQ